MKMRLFPRRRTNTTVPAVPEQPPAPAWEQEGHFQIGDAVLFPPGPSYGESVAWVRDGRVGVITNAVLDIRVHAAPDQIRHRRGCAPCAADIAIQIAAAEERENAYWNQWPADERAAYDAVMEDMQLTAGSTPGEGGGCHRPCNGTRYKFGHNSPVREWMRTEFDGHLLDSESPSLALGRIWDPIDWLRIERDHADDGLTIEVPWETVTWPTVRSAYALALEAGLDVALDVDLEMTLLDDGTIGADAVPCWMVVEGIVPDEVEQQISMILGREPEDRPHSDLIRPSCPDGPGTDFSAPYRRGSTTGHTMWFWAG